MKAKCLQISWHHIEKDGSDKPVPHPILSLDSCCSNRFVTAGTDKSVKIWELEQPAEGTEDAAGIRFIAAIRRHSGAVNCARFSRDGMYIAWLL